MKLDDVFAKYSTLLEADQFNQQPDPNAAPMNNTAAPVDPNQQTTQSQLPDATSADDMNQEDENTDSPEVLEENEKLLIEILLKIVSVLKDYIIANGSESQNVTKIDELINSTRKNLQSAENVNDVLQSFITDFDKVFEEHIEKRID